MGVVFLGVGRNPKLPINGGKNDFRKNILKTIAI